MTNADGSTSPRTRSMPSKSSSGNSKSKQQRKATSLPTETVEYLKAWMMSPEHIAHPYPTETEKAQIMKDTGIEMKQLTNWFVNNRKRYWKPRVEARLRDPHLAPLVKPDGSPLTLEDVTGDGPAVTGNSTPSAQNLGTPKRRSARRNTPIVSPPRSITNEEHSVTSYSSYDEDEETPETTTTKTVKVHILRPAICSIGDDLPELADVSVSEGTLFVAKNRILRTFDNCALTYEEGTLESEVERIKKHYLGVYLAERIMSVRVSDDDDDESLSDGDVRPTTTCKKRKEVECPTPITQASSPPSKIHCNSRDDWKVACWSANNCYDDDTLPSFEEASTFFGC